MSEQKRFCVTGKDPNDHALISTHIFINDMEAGNEFDAVDKVIHSGFVRVDCPICYVVTDLATNKTITVVTGPDVNALGDTLKAAMESKEYDS